MTNVQQGWFPDPTTGGQLRWWDGSAWTEHVTREGVAPTESVAVGATDAENGANPRKKVPAWGWIALAAAGIMALLFLRPILGLVALVVLVTAIVALVRGTPTWLRLKSRNIAIGAIAASVAVLVVSGGVNAAVQQPLSELETAPVVAPASATSTPKPTKTATPTPTPVVTTKEEIVVEGIPFERANADDPNRPRGENVVSTPGADGERTITYTITLTDGVETGRTVASDVVSRQPVTEITSVGVYDAPAPAPVVQAPVAEAAAPGGGCDPNYADGCVPIASDVDCAGGSGNGPAYFQGPARVVGSDIYDLDSDNDGVACEG